MEGEDTANTKMRKSVLAEVLQTPKWGKASLQKSCKRQNGEKRFCRNAAKPRNFFEVFAGAPQVSRETFWCLRESRKSHGKLFGVCGSPASASGNALAFAGAPQVSRKTFWRLRDSRKRKKTFWHLRDSRKHLQSRGPSGRRTEIRFRAFHAEIKLVSLPTLLGGQATR